MTKFIDGLFDHTVPGVTKSLDLYWKRNEALTSNIANAETPQYRAVDMDFAGELKQAFESAKPGGKGSELKTTNPRHLDLRSQGTSRFVADYSGATKADGNNVDLDIQMGKMVYNSGKFGAGTAIIRKKLRMMRMAIQRAMR